MSDLTDEELRDQLADHGFKAGPINDTTRKIYIKKLEMMKMNAKKAQPKTSTVKQPISITKIVSKPTESITPSKVSKNDATKVLVSRLPPKRTEDPQEKIDLTIPTPKISKSYFTVSETESEEECVPVTQNNKSNDFLGRKSINQFFNDSSNNTVGISAQSSLLFTPERNSLARKSRLSCFSRIGSVRSSAQEESINLSQSAFIKPKKPNGICGENQIDNNSSLGANLKFILFAIALSYFLYFLIANLRSYEGQTGDFGSFEISHLICSSNDILAKNCIKSSIKEKVSVVFKDLVNMLGRYSGCYHCQIPFNDHSLAPSSPALSVDIAKSLIIGYLMNDESINEIWNGVMLVLKNFGPERSGILLKFSSGEKIKTMESLIPHYTILCRLNLVYKWFVNWVWYISIASLTSVFFVSFFYLFYSWRKSFQERKIKQECLLQEINAFIIDILQSSQLESERNGSRGTANVALSKIKLQVQAKFPESNHLWDEVCSRIREKESCIIEECLRGLGDTWRWRSGVGWQGSALADSSVNSGKISKPPSECLKIRNMFLSEGSLSAEQEARIKRQLFQKISHCGGICHMSLVPNDTSLNSSMSNNQISSHNEKNSGIIYVLCMSPEVAAQVYNAVNAHYFDSRLVIVKFITLNRYYQRFPEAANALRALNEQDFE